MRPRFFVDSDDAAKRQARRGGCRFPRLFLCLFLLVFLSSCGRGADTGGDASGQEEASAEQAVSSGGAGQAGAGADSTGNDGKEAGGTDQSGQAGTGTNDAAEGGADGESGAAAPALTAETVPEEARMRVWDVRLGFAGDINFADDYIPVQYLESLGSDDISDGIDERFIDLMQGMDLMWINNEFTYSTRGEPLYGKTFTFRSDPKHVSWLHDLGIDIVGLANNHSFDYGEEAFLDTMTVLEDAGIPYVGAGHDLAEAMQPVYLEADGFTIAYVAASCAELTVFTQEAEASEPGILACYDDTRFLQAIREAAAHADYVIALPHWGVEHSTWLDEKQPVSAQAYLDAGADAVIGAHPHILQGIQFSDGRPILYSLGNFWFDNFDIDTVVAELHFSGSCRPDETPSLRDGSVEVILYPGTQSGVYTAWADTPEWRESIFALLESISQDVTIDEDGRAHPVEYDDGQGNEVYEQASEWG